MATPIHFVEIIGEYRRLLLGHNADNFKFIKTKCVRKLAYLCCRVIANCIFLKSQIETSI